MTELHKLINLMKAADDLERQAMSVLGSHKHSEVQQIMDLKSSLWGRIYGAIDTEKESLRELPY